MASYLPLRTVISQSLLLMVTIAVEAFVLRQQLSISKQKSIEYSASVNLLSTILGWILFFLLIPLFPVSAELQLINFLFFDQWSVPTATWLITGALLTFFVSYGVELLGLELLQRMMSDRPESQKDQRYVQPQSYPSKRLSYTEEPSQGIDKRYALLVANATSYTLVVIILLVFRLVSEASIIPDI
jgi:hypothetical protein